MNDVSVNLSQAEGLTFQPLPLEANAGLTSAASPSVDPASVAPASVAPASVDPASLDCGGHPDPEGVCAIKGCTDEMMTACASHPAEGSGACGHHAPEHEGIPDDGEAHASPSRWHIPPRPRREDFPPPPTRLHRRWDRTARLVGDGGMHRLQNAHVVVFGLGGVGSFAVEGLARSGVGRLTLVDFDDVCVTNFNRQLHALRATIGKPKAVLMAERVQAINPDVYVEPIQAFYEAETSEALLSPTPDFVVDCIDNVTAKMHLLSTCIQRGIPVVSSMGAAARLDPTRVRVCDLSETYRDPLAKAIRKHLGRNYNIDCTQPTGVTAVFSDEPILEPVELEYDATTGFLCVCPHRENSPHSCEKRSIIHGTAVFVTSVFGMTCASVVVRKLTEGSRPMAV